MWNEEETYQGYNEEEFGSAPADVDNIPSEEEYYSEEVEEIDEEQLDALNEQLEVRENEVLDSAMVRLDQAKLYKMLIEHDLFQDVDAHPFALKKVQSEIRQFIMDRLEILLGMKKEVKVNQNTTIELPFNDLEIQALKDIAAKLTKGASQTAPEPAKQSLKPVTPQKSNVLKPVSAPAKPAFTPPKAQPQAIKKAPASASKPPAPVKKQQPQPSPKPAQKKQTAPDIPEHLRKNPFEMTQEELMERAKYSAVKKQVKNPEAIPMPNQDQLAAITMNKSMASSVNNPYASLLAGLGAVPVADVGGKDDMY